MGNIGLGVALVSLAIWLVFLGFRGQFWRTDQQLEPPEPLSSQAEFPAVCAVIPARNEADLLPITLRSLLQQDYPGNFTVILVDDQSTDGTAEVAQHTAQELGKSSQLQVISAEPLPAGWTGKLWAMNTGIQHAQTLAPDYILLTDADIQHDGANLRQLVEKAIRQNLDLASVMVRLRCESFWEKLLIPAFVFFFQKLYPFRWVNNPNNSTAAAAGGCILIRRAALEGIGGIAAIRHALIDDCALAQAVKTLGSRAQRVGKDKEAGENKGAAGRNPETWHLKPDHSPSGKIWLGLSDRTYSLRPYPNLATIWDMVARTAFTQLNYSPLLLLGTIAGMTVIYLVPPLALLLGAMAGSRAIALVGLASWLLMTLAYFPMIRFYRCPRWLAGCLPAIALLYTLMTLDSALRHWQGQGGAWKGRVYKH